VQALAVLVLRKRSLEAAEDVGKKRPHRPGARPDPNGVANRVTELGPRVD
jgi:hypothetical protein